MQFWLPILLVFLLCSSHFGSSVYAKSCRKDEQCSVSKRFCAFCMVGRGPICTIPICLNKCCGVINACSLELNGTCTTARDCITPFFCEACKGNSGPACTKPICFGGQCVVVGPCSIQP